MPSSEPFEPQPTLGGRLIELRPLAASDFDALFAVAADPSIWEQHPDKSRCTPEGFRRFFDQGLASGGALLVTDRATGAVIGSSRYFGFDAAAAQVEIGWTFLARRCWGGSYNGELKQLMVDHAFTWVDRIVFVIAPMNRRSQLAVGKIGAVRVGSRFDRDGTESYIFALTPAGWASR